MYGDTGNKLVLEAKRSVGLNSIPIYSSDLIKDVVREINDLNRDVEYLVEERSRIDENPNEAETRINECQLFVTHLSIRRNKRCLLAYEKLRSDKIVEFSWLNIDPTEASSSQPSSSVTRNDNVNPTTKNITNYTTSLDINNLNHFEQDFLKQYQDLIMEFKTNFEDIDLSGDLNPPTNIFIDVRVLKDGGEVTTEYGSFNLIKDSQFFVRKSDVERLIQQGYLEEIV
ncbi:PSF1 DNA replication complex GINS protein PSF1 [Candida maltosa Xu316]|uniref:DNA replication complex GINS protein PSF1 n=1 Tax=Candida maltosa (strain Xu316) TaxID=1245528 RepID=M3J5F0_CANMX|nr:DNA replication complex GINS protein PSF1 [Candida maltosa Xu316]